nr:hypothetical protein [uncultured Desulfuromonas sp.]
MSSLRVLVCLTLLLGFSAWAASSADSALLQLNGNWNQPYGDDSDSWKLGQSYSLSLGNDLTSALRFSGSMRYTTNQSQDTATTETLAPSLRMGLNNDLFDISVNASQTERKTGSSDTTLNRSWNTTFVTRLDESYWPRLRVNFGQNSTTNDSSPKTTDTHSTNVSSSLNYTWHGMTLLYDFTNSITTNEITETENDTTTHTLRGQLQQSLWNNRVNIIASHQYSHNRSISTTTGSSREITQNIHVVSGLYSLDDTPQDDALGNESALIDGDRLTSTTVQLIQPTQTVNVGVQINLNPFNELIFYLNREIDQSIRNLLNWTFYTSQDNQNWSQMATFVSPSYELENGQTIVRFNFDQEIENIRYVKAILTRSVSTETVYLTEIEVNYLLTLNEGDNAYTSTTTSQRSQAGISVRPWEKWSLGYTAQRHENRTSSDTHSVQLNQSFNSALTWNRFFALSMNINDNTDDIDGQDPTTSRSYSLAYQANPLNTLTFSLGATRSERYTDTDKTNQTDNINCHLSAVLFPDLSAGVSANWNQIKTFDDDNGDATSKSRSYQFNLATRFTPRFNFSANCSLTQDDEEDGGFSYSLNSTYRPSSYFSMTTSYQHGNGDSFSHRFNLWLTNKIQSDVRYTFIKTDSTLQSIRFSAIWNLSQQLNLRNTINWSKDDEDTTWKGLATVNYNF